MRKTLELVREQITEATEGYDWDDQAEFFGELAAWAGNRQEILSVSPDVEMQDFESE